MTDAPRTPPKAVLVRLADLQRHFGALRHAMSGFGDDFDLEPYELAAASDDPVELARVYAVERPFELLDNYVIELGSAGLVAAGVYQPGSEPTSGIAILRALRDQGVISAERCTRLERIHRARTDVQHEYPDVRAHNLHEAAHLLVAELPGFVGDYQTWLRKLGFGKSQRLGSAARPSTRSR